MEEINEFEDPVDRHLSFIDFANDAIWALKRLIPMYAVVISGGCYYAGRKVGEPGSPEFIEALERAKERFTDPNYKQHNGAQKKKIIEEQNKIKKLSPKKIKEAKTHVKAMVIKHNGGDPDTAGIVAEIDMKIEYHQGMIGKLKQAKNVLS